MKFLYTGKDGGPASNVTGYWLLEWKRGCSIALLKFTKGSRDAYHSHAFHALSWLLWGRLVEHCQGNAAGTWYAPSLRPIITKQTTFHKVRSEGTSWVLTFRGPWAQTWEEYRPDEHRFVTLGHGRVEQEVS